MREQLTNIADYIEALEQRIADMEAAMATQAASIAALQNQITSLHSQLSDQLAAMQSSIDEMGESIVPQPSIATAEEVTTVEPTCELAQEIEPVPAPEVVPEPMTEPAQDSELNPVSEPAPESELTVTMANRVNGAAVQELRQAISVGDKFLFQRELFGQSGERMLRTLEKLDTLQSFDEAMEYIQQFYWNKESQAYELFINVLHRRFG